MIGSHNDFINRQDPRNVEIAIMFFHTHLDVLKSPPRHLLKQKQIKVELLREAPQKKNGKMWEFWKNRGGGLPESHIHFLLFLTWETPPKKQNKPCFFSIFLKKKTCHSQTGGRGGGPPLGKNSHIFPFFFGGSFPYEELVLSCVPIPKYLSTMDSTVAWFEGLSAWGCEYF